MECIRGNYQEQRGIQAELQAYRDAHFQYVQATHPATEFVRLSELRTSAQYRSLVDQNVLVHGTHALEDRFRALGCEPLSPERVWVGIKTSYCENMFGGFHHANQGYRYLQQIAILSVIGAPGNHRCDTRLTSLELLRSYIHDTIHYNSFRAYLPLSLEKAMVSNAENRFFRFQYGINFRRCDGTSYSAKDPVKATTTRNLGVIMEAATDRLAQEVVLQLANGIGYSPADFFVERYVYHDCTGQITPLELTQLRAIEKESNDEYKVINAYLKSMRLFCQYVTMRYRNFLAEFDPDQRYGLHQRIIDSILSGKMKALTQCLDEILSRKKSFVYLFKDPHY